MFYIYVILCGIFCGSYVEGMLWKNGIIHYSINDKDYDVRSQDIILSTISHLQEIMCVKFFRTAPDHAARDYDKILYINNPDRRKACPKNAYDFTKSIVDMPIGYKCMNQKDIARIIVEMLFASIDSNGSAMNIEGLGNRFPENGTEAEIINSPFISSWERNYINSNYKSECGLVTPPLLPSLRRQSAIDDITLSAANLEYYRGKSLRALGIVFYVIKKEFLHVPVFNETMKVLKQAMNIIERLTCIVFHEIDSEEPTKPIDYDTYGGDFADPAYPCMTGPGQSCLSRLFDHLFYKLRVPVMSNRFDRDHYVTINWKKVDQQAKFNKEPEGAWIVGLPYDFNSVMHPPANYICKEACYLGDNVIRPKQDYLWQREMSMGHAEMPSEYDIKMIDVLYRDECRKRSEK